MKEKILFLTTELPYPLDSGGKIRTFNMLKSIYKEYEIDLICFSEGNQTQEDIDELKKVCKNIFIVDKIYKNSKSKTILVKNILFSLLKNKPFIIEKFNDKRYRERVRKLLSENKYKAIVIDHLQAAQYIKYLDENKVILSQHNCEYIILKRRFKEERNLLRKQYLYIEYKKTQRYEKRICKNVDTVIMLSNEDKDFLIDDNYNGDNIKIIPISIEFKYKKENYNSYVKNILFLGTMSWFPNEQGILWFLQNGWNKIKKINNDMKLFIVGSNPSKEILSYKSDNIIVTGYVDSVDEYIEKCDVCIIPLFIGGGMRVKILECMAKGIPCISTSIGAEGIECKDNEDILIANKINEFVHAITKLDNPKIVDQIVRNGLDNIKRNYSNEVIGKKIKEILDE